MQSEDLSMTAMEQRLLDEDEQALIAELGIPPTSQEYELYYRLRRQGTYKTPEWESQASKAARWI